MHSRAPLVQAGLWPARLVSQTGTCPWSCQIEQQCYLACCCCCCCCRSAGGTLSSLRCQCPSVRPRRGQPSGEQGTDGDAETGVLQGRRPALLSRRQRACHSHPPQLPVRWPQPQTAQTRNKASSSASTAPLCMSMELDAAPDGIAAGPEQFKEAGQAAGGVQQQQQQQQQPQQTNICNLHRSSSSSSESPQQPPTAAASAGRRHSARPQASQHCAAPSRPG